MKQFFLLTAFLFFTCLSFAQTRNFRVVKAPTDNPVANQTRKAVVIGMSKKDINQAVYWYKKCSAQEDSDAGALAPMRL